LKNKDKMS
jgi:hypothetical protein